MDYTEKVVVVGPRGRPLKLDWGTGYAKVSVPDKSRKSCQITVHLHLLVELDKRLKENKTGSLVDCAYPEGWEVNHIDGDKSNNLPHNLEVGPKSLNQARKVKPALGMSLEQIVVLREMARVFPNVNYRALATAIRTPVSEIQRALDQRDFIDAVRLN